jgi:hypothetical protein
LPDTVPPALSNFVSTAANVVSKLAFTSSAFAGVLGWKQLSCACGQVSGAADCELAVRAQKNCASGEEERCDPDERRRPGSHASLHLDQSLAQVLDLGALRWAHETSKVRAIAETG